MFQHNGDVLFSSGAADSRGLRMCGGFMCEGVHILILTGVSHCNTRGQNRNKTVLRKWISVSLNS